jgi:hypothetical protein
MDNRDSTPDSSTTTAFRLERKALKEIFSKRQDGLSKQELAKSAEAKGIAGDEFERVLSSLLAGGHLYLDGASGKYHFVRNE